MLNSINHQYKTSFSKKKLMYCPPQMSNKYIEKMVHQSRDSFTTANINLSIISKLVSSCFTDDLKKLAKANIQRLKNTLSNLNGLFEEVEILDQFELTIAPNKLDDVNLMFLINKYVKLNQKTIKEKQLNVFIASNSADTQLTSNPIIASYILKSVISHVIENSACCAEIKIRCEMNENQFEISLREVKNEPIAPNLKSNSLEEIEEQSNNLNQIKLLANLLGGGLLVSQQCDRSKNKFMLTFVDFSYQWPV